MRLDALISEQSGDLGILPAIRAIISDANVALAELSRHSRWIHIFWLLGPFILLVERTPADVWLSFIGIVFAFRTIIKKDTAWLKIFWVRAAFAFWGWCIFSASISSNPTYSIGESVAWFRFPLFAMATVFWLGCDRRLLHAMLLSTAFGLVIMSSILGLELAILGQQGGRLTWPYGDPVPGSYIAKVGLPVFTVMVALAVSVSNRLAVLSGFLALITLAISLMTGERINFLIRACGGMLAGLMWRPRWRRYLFLIFIELLAVFLLFRLVPGTQTRFVSEFVEQLPTDNNSPYAQAMLPAIEAFKTAPYVGIGPGNFGAICPELNITELNYVCHPHPHNFYFQMLGETGLIGLCLGCILLFSITWQCFLASVKNRSNVLDATSWVVPFGLFWPIASTADFFGQWNNIFLWSAVSLALGVTSSFTDKKLK